MKLVITVLSFLLVEQLPLITNAEIGPVFRFATTTYSASEGQTVEVCVVVNPFATMTTEEITLDLVTNGVSAVLGQDFTGPLPSSTLTFLNGSTITDVQCATYQLVSPDMFLEGDETFAVSLTNISSGMVGTTNSTATVTIMDIDMATVELELAETVVEGGVADVVVSLATNGASLTVDVTVTLSTAFDMSGSNPADASDFITILGTEIIFQAGGSIEKSLVLSAKDDSVVEGNETFLLQIDDVIGPAVPGTPSNITIIITDDDNMLVIIFDAMVSDDMGVEGNSGLFEVCVKAIGGGTALQDSVTVTFAIEGSTDDIVQPYTPEAVLPASSQLRGCTSFGIEDDDLVEGTEELTFTIDQISSSLGFMIGDPRIFVFSIADNDGGIIISFVSNGMTVMEGDGMIQVCTQLTISSGKTLGSDIWVPLAATDDGTANIGVDFTIPVSAVTFLASDTLTSGHMECIHVMIVDDCDYEADQTFTVMRNPSILIPRLASISGSVVITIRDNIDTLVAMTHAMLTVTETAGTVDVCVDPGIRGNVERELVVSLQADDGMATKGDAEDFTEPARLEVTFTTRNPECVTFDILDDDLLEGDHDFSVEIINVGDAVLDSRSTSTTITIDDDEQGVLVFATPSSSVTEGSTATDVCVSVSAGSPPASALASDLIIFLSTISGEAEVSDFVDDTYTVTFEMGTPFPLENCVDIPTTQDDELEGYQYFTVSLVGTSPNDAVMISEPSTHVITIIDDDITSVSIQPRAFSIPEDVGTISVCVEIDNLQTEELESNVTISVLVEDITTEQGEDFTVISPTTTLTFSSGVSDGHSECIQINIIDDDIYEEGQQFFVTIFSVSASLPTIAIGDSTNIYRLEDNTDAEVRFVMEEYSVGEESGSVSICVESGVMDGFETALTVNLSAQDGTASVTDDISLPEPFQVMFSVGQNTSTSCVSIPITNDKILEGDHTFTVFITSALYAIVNSPSAVLVTIIDDEVASVGVQLTASSISEDIGTINVCVEFNAPQTDEMENNITVGLGVEDVTAEQGEDFTVISPTTTLTFSSGVSDGHSECIQINIIDDDIYEEEQQFNVSIFSIIPTYVFNTSYIDTYRLEDNTDAEVRFVMEDYSVDKESGSVSICVESGVMDGFETTLTVNLSAQDGTASVTGDISLPDPFQVIFSVSQNTSTSCLMISLTSDAVFDGDRNFTVSISSSESTPYVLVGSPSVALVTIMADDGNDEGSDNNVNLSIVIAVAIGASVVVAIIAFLLGVCLHHVFIKYACNCKKGTKQQTEPSYDDIVLNPRAELPHNLPAYANNAASNTDDGAIVSSQNEAYSIVRGTGTLSEVSYFI